MAPARPAAQRWSPARCQFTLIAVTALIDRQLSADEEFETLALGARSLTMHELSLETTQGWMQELIAIRTNQAAIWEHARKATRDFPSDPSMRRAIYAHCADMAFADRQEKKSERRLLDFIAKDLRLSRADRQKIDAVMALKNRH
jgi:hypothetical protein